MKSSSKFVVAVHVLAGLAVVRLKNKDTSVSSQNIAWSVNTNPVVIRRLLGALKRAGLVETESGSGGGTRIGKSPDKITLSDVYEAVEEGSVFHYHYAAPNQECPVGRNIQNALHGPLDLAEEVMKKELSKTTIKDVAEKILVHM